MLDDSYRKAGKLDCEVFGSNVSPYETGIINGIAQLLLPSLHTNDTSPRGVRAELYELNVYSGTDGSSKHTLTRRGAKSSSGVWSSVCPSSTEVS